MTNDADKPTSANNPTGPKVDARLLEILVCPVTRAELTYDPVRQELVSRAARLAFPIRAGAPIVALEVGRMADEGGGFSLVPRGEGGGRSPPDEGSLAL